MSAALNSNLKLGPVVCTGVGDPNLSFVSPSNCDVAEIERKLEALGTSRKTRRFKDEVVTKVHWVAMARERNGGEKVVNLIFMAVR